MPTNIEEVLTGLKPAIVSWNEGIRRSVIHYLVTDRSFFLRHVAHFIPEALPDKIHVQMFAAARDHFKAYDKLPSLYVMLDKMKAVYAQRWPGEWVSAESEIYRIYEASPCETDVDYIDDMILKYSKYEAIKLALRNSFDTIHNPKINQDVAAATIERMIRDAVSISLPKNDEFINFFADARVTLSADAVEQMTEKFTCGFLGIDAELDGGLSWGEIALYLGDSGVGKSQILAYVAGKNIAMGRNVLFVSIENTEPVVKRRFNAHFSAVPMNEVKNHKGTVLERLSAFADNERLRLKTYEPGSVGISDMSADLERYVAATGWTPQVIVLDYIDELKRYEGMSTYDAQGVFMLDFKGWLHRTKTAGFSATQANRNASTTSIVTRSETGDCYWKIRRSDAVWTINANGEDEIPRGLMRLYVDKHRNGKKGYMVYCMADLSRCSFTQISREEYDRRMKVPIPA